MPSKHKVRGSKGRSQPAKNAGAQPAVISGVNLQNMDDVPCKVCNSPDAEGSLLCEGALALRASSASAHKNSDVLLTAACNSVYHWWCAKLEAAPNEDEPFFCPSCKLSGGEQQCCACPSEVILNHLVRQGIVRRRRAYIRLEARRARGAGARFWRIQAPKGTRGQAAAVAW